MKQMTKQQALEIIVDDGRADRGSKTSYNRVIKALAALGLNKSEQDEILSRLDYHSIAGTPYPCYAESVK